MPYAAVCAVRVRVRGGSSDRSGRGHHCSKPVPSASVQLGNQRPQTVSEGSATAIVSLGPLKVTVSKDGFFPGVVILPDETTAAQLSPDFIGGLRKPGWR